MIHNIGLPSRKNDKEAAQFDQVLVEYDVNTYGIFFRLGMSWSQPVIMMITTSFTSFRKI